MSQDMNAKPTSSTSMSTMLLTFLAGATVGAVVVALTTPKSGKELRGSLKAAGRLAKQKFGHCTEEAEEKWDDLKERTLQAADDVQRGVTDAAKTFRA